jgi:hypothetical protein
MVMLVMTPLLLAASEADGGLSLDEVDDIVAFHAPELARVSDGATADPVRPNGTNSTDESPERSESESGARDPSTTDADHP